MGVHTLYIAFIITVKNVIKDLTVLYEHKLLLLNLLHSG